ncbi:tetratricopeptide repeat protein [Actinoplanes derwentensis]|nr:hypothetical protein [Actinoplanes derwentensis]
MALAAAQGHAAAGRPADAVDLLHPHLHDRTFTRTAPDAVLIEACTLYAALAVDSDRLPAAEYAYRASRNLHPDPGHPRRLDAATAYATVLHETGRLTTAIGVYQHLLGVFRGLEQPADIIAVAMNLGRCLHAVGRCPEALHHVGTAWRLWQHTDLTNTEFGIQLLDTYLKQLSACRQHRDLQTLVHHLQRQAVWRALLTADPDLTRHRIFISAHQNTVCTYQPQPPDPVAGHSEHHNHLGRLHHPDTDPATAPTRTTNLQGPTEWAYNHQNGEHPLADTHAASPGSALAAPPTEPLLPTSHPDDADQNGSAYYGDARREPSLVGHPTIDVATAISRALATPQAQAMLRHDLGHPAGTATDRWMTAMVVAYVAYQRTLRVSRASPYTAAVVLPVIVATLTLALVWPR